MTTQLNTIRVGDYVRTDFSGDRWVRVTVLERTSRPRQKYGRVSSWVYRDSHFVANTDDRHFVYSDQIKEHRR